MSAILAVNRGSSSLKYRLFDAGDGSQLADGLVERLDGDEAAQREAIGGMLASLHSDIVGVGHRVVHGGSRFTQATVVDAEVERAIDDLAPLAPLHNPPALSGIRAIREQLPVPQIAVFDTAFHATIPAAAATYALDRELAEQWGIRRYGFHGISYASASRRIRPLLRVDPDAARVIALHLGNGASVAAIRGGTSVDTSMGFSPLEGLVMGQRSGSLDPAIPGFLQRTAGMTAEQVDDLLNHRSGMLGLSGHSDMRDVGAAAAHGDAQARLALDVYVHRLVQYLGSYAAVLGGVDAVVFTGGVGEHADDIRAAAIEGLGFLGVRLDPALNAASENTLREIGASDSAAQVIVVPADEESELARATAGVLGIPTKAWR